MSESQVGIDRVLQALRDVETPANLESRVMDALAQRAAVQHQPSWYRFFAGSPIWLRTAAALAGLCVAGFLIVIVTRTPQPPRMASGERPRRASTPPIPLLASQAPAGFPAPHSPSISARTADRNHRHTPRPTSTPAVVDLATAEANAPSLPAPPLPLTRQERLLLRFARRSRTEEYALLTPEFRAREYAAERAAFRAYFDPPSPTTTE